MSDRECSTSGRVCNTTLGQCVECNAMIDCTGGRACLGNRCVTTVACTSSRTCPGQVCSARLGYCVDCEADVDCTGGHVCRGNVCAAPPRMCRSSRECSDIGLVCAMTRGQCVECVSDTDCPTERYCGPMLTCLARICTPNASTCVSGTRVAVCNAVGSAQRETDCAVGQSCRDNTCQANVCVPGQVSCDPTSTMRRRCNEDGGGYTPMPCAKGEACRDAMCVPRACTPGMATCTSATERRVCAPDGLSTTVASCGSNEGCREGACVARTCVPGSGACVSTTTRNVCNADGFGTTPMDCGSMQRCAAGVCVDLACAPGSSTCTSTTTVRVCSADGASFMTVTCPTSSTCAGTMCSSWVCTPGNATCAVGATARTVCNADGLSTRSEPCVAPANAGMPRCGAANACTFTCNAGFGDCNALAADGCEAALATDAANCGRCGGVCAPRTNTTASCAAGVCDYRCAAGFGDCDGNAANGCETSLSAPTSCGRCGVVCPTGMSCAGGTCSSEMTLRVDSLSTAGCRSIDHDVVSGDDRGGIAVSRSQVFYSGDTATIRASLTDLGALAGVAMPPHDGMLSDLATGQVYVLMDATGREVASQTMPTPFVVTQLGLLDGATGALTPDRVVLSAPIRLVPYSGSGIFSGRGRAYIFSSEGFWHQILLPSGATRVLRDSVGPYTHSACESWAHWGIAEYFDGEAYALYVRDLLTVVRYRIRDGMESVVLSLVGTSIGTLSDLCSLTLSPTNNRWYFHYEGNGFAGGASETLGYCPASFSTP